MNYEDIPEIKGYPKIPLGKAENLIGKKYDRLTPLYRAKNLFVKKQTTYWVCKCECGNISLVKAEHLKNKKIKSCGCLNKEQLQRNAEKNLDNLIGRQFGNIVPLELLPKISHTNSRQYRCKCLNCGNENYIAISENLKNRAYKYCPLCRPKSKGEEDIAQILTKNNIPFIREHHFKDCYFTDTHYPAKFDFYINNKYIIEYDGEQHYRQSYWNYPLIRVQEHDNIKNQYCKENNIPLIRIPYTHYSEICLEDLLLETTPFRVV